MQTDELPHDPEEETLLAVEGAVFTARVDPATGARPGGPLQLAVDPDGFHYFDLETGENRGRGVAPERAAPPLVNS